MISRDDVARFFTTTQISIAGNPLLREPQRDGHAKAVEYFAGGGDHAVEQIPVGCGKSGLITLLPFGCAAGRVLVIAPNLTIRNQLVDSFSSSSTTCFYKRSRALTNLTDGPFVAALDATANLSDLDEAHVAVTNIQQLTEGGRWLDKLDTDFFDMIIVDEGHHNVAATWQGVFNWFPNAKVISLTATPFRADDQPVEGEVIYRYPIAEAMRQGFIKTIQASNVAPRELVFSYRGDDRVHTLEEVLRLKERDWFSRGVALAEPCNVSIVDASIEWLNHLRQSPSGLRHQIVAAACSIDHARAIRRLYEERGYEAREIHSDMRDEEKERIHRDLQDGKLDVIVQVQMLGEGFDHPPLSIAVVFRPYRSLNPYIQFVGRVMRTNVNQTPGHPDNRGIIVSHVGLNIDRHWDDFKTIDVEDQELVHSWLLSEPHTPPVTPEQARRPLLPNMIVTDELTLDTFLGDTFLDVSEESMPDRVLDTLRAQGIDPAAAGLNREILEVLIQTRQSSEPTGPRTQPVQPQARRKAQKARLNEQERTIAMRICQATGLSPVGRKISTKLGASNDLTAAIQLMKAEVNRFLGIPPRSRRDLSIQQIESALTNLETIADTVEADVRGRIN
jgi:superfamily II DNA or RNA helicase